MTPPTCPHCGAILDPEQIACPDCGSCAETGWSAEARYQEADIPDPDEEFNYDEFVAREFGGAPESRAGQRHWIWFVVALLLIALLLSYYF